MWKKKARFGFNVKINRVYIDKLTKDTEQVNTVGQSTNEKMVTRTKTKANGKTSIKNTVVNTDCGNEVPPQGCLVYSLG